MLLPRSWSFKSRGSFKVLNRVFNTKADGWLLRPDPSLTPDSENQLPAHRPHWDMLNEQTNKKKLAKMLQSSLTYPAPLTTLLPLLPRHRPPCLWDPPHPSVAQDKCPKMCHPGLECRFSPAENNQGPEGSGGTFGLPLWLDRELAPGKELAS